MTSRTERYLFIVIDLQNELIKLRDDSASRPTSASDYNNIIFKQFRSMIWFL